MFHHAWWNAGVVSAPWPRLALVAVDGMVTQEERTKSNVTPDPGGHRPQRPYAQGWTCGYEVVCCLGC